MAKRDLLKLSDDFEANVRALLGTPPAPAGTAGSRRTVPKPPAKPKPKARKGKAYRRTKAEAAAHRASKPQGVRYAYESAPAAKRKKR